MLKFNRNRTSDWKEFAGSKELFTCQSAASDEVLSEQVSDPEPAELAHNQANTRFHQVEVQCI